MNNILLILVLVLTFAIAYQLGHINAFPAAYHSVYTFIIQSLHK